MKALTICQPYAHLICLPEGDERGKFVENRTWETFYRGPLLIHAGKSKKWLPTYERTSEIGPLTYGAIIGVCRLLECVHVPSLLEGRRYRNLTDAWMNAVIAHEHTSGPFGFVLSERRRFAREIPYQGAQGFFNVPDDLICEQVERVWPGYFTADAHA